MVFNDALRVRDEAYRAGVKLPDSEIQRQVITKAKTTEARLAGRGAQCRVGPVGQRFPPGVAQLFRLGHRKASWPQSGPSAVQIAQGSEAIVSADPQRVQPQRPNRRLFVAKVGEVRVRWSRELPSAPSSVTIIREPDGHFYASFVVKVSAVPLPATDQEAGVDVGIARLATVATTDGERIRRPNPSTRSQAAQIAAVGAGEVPPAERIAQQRQDQKKGRGRAQ